MDSFENFRAPSHNFSAQRSFATDSGLLQLDVAEWSIFVGSKFNFVTVFERNLNSYFSVSMKRSLPYVSELMKSAD